MTEVFLLQNQDKYFLSKKSEWVDGREPTGLFRTPRKDEAVNQMFEVNAKDYSLRIQLVSCPLDNKGVPEIAAETLPPRQQPAEPSTGQAAAADTDPDDPPGIKDPPDREVAVSHH